MTTINEQMSTHPSADQPATGAVAITQAAQPFSPTGRAILVTTAGNITFTLQDGSTMALTNIATGLYPFTVRSIASATLAGLRPPLSPHD